ncbi:MAG: YihA family ribosome biogenesis GTP-binding protein [Francisellaceae bacterium]|nr:YihA family ribosome biogenesis GTP-binding protein [Francisellaceae bacterium]MBT6538911.1 YihA family ribosome biogenesis GTP-binding protein [Francisellaceae bacterium]
MAQKIHFNNASYLTSATKLGECPTDIIAEVAFIGRSNAGKSSAINAITNQKSLAKTSKTPGRTQMINFFALTLEHNLVDLPGYGYARVMSDTKQSWETMITSYLLNRDALKGLIILMDIRHPFKESDIQTLRWAESYNIPVHVALTKSDKYKNGPAKNIFFSVQKQLKEISPTSSVSLFSAMNKTGVEQLQDKIRAWLTQNS